MTALIVIIILSVLVFVHEFGHFLMAKWTGTRVDEFAIGFKPTIFSKKIGETTYMLNLIPFGGYVKILGEDTDNPDTLTNTRSMNNKSRWQQAVILFGGVLFNIIFAWILMVGIFSQSVPVGEDAAARYPAYVTQNDSGYILDLPLQHAFIQGSKSTYKMTKDTTLSFVDLIKGIFTGSSSADQLTGPVGLGDVVNQARSFGLSSIILLTAFISINLAVLNLIPFPALDGGRLFVLLIESVTRRKIKPIILQWVNGISFLLLILLMIFVTIGDISRLIG